MASSCAHTKGKRPLLGCDIASCQRHWEQYFGQSSRHLLSTTSTRPPRLDKFQAVIKLGFRIVSSLAATKSS